MQCLGKVSYIQKAAFSEEVFELKTRLYNIFGNIHITYHASEKEYAVPLLIFSNDTFYCIFKVLCFLFME